MATELCQLLAETADFWVIEKAAGVPFHAEAAQQGLCAIARTYLGVETLYPVHRLDKITSGLVLFAKTPLAAAQLGELFSSHSIEKTYWALSDRPPHKKQGWIKGDMQKSRNGCYQLCRTQQNPAVTYFTSHSLAPRLRAYVLHPKTGRTHQLRVAMKSLGSPILGDTRYGGTPAARAYLHAQSLSFNWKGEALVFTCTPKNWLFTLD